MDEFLEAIKTELKQQQIKYGYTDVHSLTEHIWRSYTEDNPISNDRLCELNRRMDPILNSIPIAASDTLFLLFWEFCQEYERAAFLEGFRLGARLMAEIYDGPINHQKDI